MRCYRVLMIAAMVVLAVTTYAQQTTTGSKSPAKAVSQDEELSVPTVDAQLKTFIEKLDLTVAQQVRIKPVLQTLHDQTDKILQEKNVSRDERLAKVRPRRYEANETIRTMLTEEQNKKLDLYFQGPHQEVHGTLSGATPAPQPSKR
jgi:hypothetical protein